MRITITDGAEAIATFRRPRAVRQPSPPPYGMAASVRRARVTASDLCGHTGSLRAGTCCEHRFGHRPRRPEPGRIRPRDAPRPVAREGCERISYSNLSWRSHCSKRAGCPSAYSQPDTRKAATRSQDPRRSGHAQPRPPPPTQAMASTSKKSLKAALALGGGLVTVGLMAAMLTDDDGPPEDVVDGVQSTMNGLVDKAGGAVAAMAASVGEAVKSSLGGVLKTAAPPSKTKKTKRKKTAKTKAKTKARKARKAAKKAAAAPVTPPKKTAPARDEPVVPEAPPPAVVEAPSLRRRARVEALWAGTWYGAVVEELHGDGSYEVEWTDTPNVFNTVAAADVRARAAAAGGRKRRPAAPRGDEGEEPEEERPRPLRPPPRTTRPARRSPRPRPRRPRKKMRRRPRPRPAADDAGGAEDVQGLLDGAAPRVVVDMLLANESFKIAFDQDNPKRPDSASWTRYEAYKAATCGEQVLELGGSKSDVLHDYKKGFLRVTRCPAMIAYDLDRDAVAPEEPVTTGRPARRAPKRE